jgi:hypothetical protein
MNPHERARALWVELSARYKVLVDDPRAEAGAAVNAAIVADRRRTSADRRQDAVQPTQQRWDRRQSVRRERVKVNRTGIVGERLT